MGRHLGKLQYIISEATGLDIANTCDDLVFPERGDFMLQIDETDENTYFCYFHEDCDVSQQQHIIAALEYVCAENGCAVVDEGIFTLSRHGSRMDVCIL